MSSSLGLDGDKARGRVESKNSNLDPVREYTDPVSEYTEYTVLM